MRFPVREYYLLNAAIVSSIESNWCAISVGEGISVSFLPLTEELRDESLKVRGGAEDMV